MPEVCVKITLIQASGITLFLLIKKDRSLIQIGFFLLLKKASLRKWDFKGLNLKSLWIPFL